MDPFREPVSIIDKSNNDNGVLVNLDRFMLEAWSKHVAYSMRLRLRSFEPGILAELTSGTVLAASTLLRAHLEAAAMAALCVDALNDCRKDGDDSTLRTLIPKTMFGAALFATARQDELAQSFLSYAEQRTITIRSAIAALDAFIYREHAKGQLGRLYGLLCEYAHPNHRGTKDFTTSEPVDESGEHGWKIVYSPTESLNVELLRETLDALYLSMVHGYAATELLRCADFSASDGFPYQGVPPDQLRRIWTSVLQRTI